MSNSKSLTEIKNQTFIDMNDLTIILGGKEKISNYMVKKYFQTIRKIAVDDLASQKLIIPKRTIIPAIYVWQYLKPYGITR